MGMVTLHTFGRKEPTYLAVNSVQAHHKCSIAPQANLIYF